MAAASANQAASFPGGVVRVRTSGPSPISEKDMASSMRRRLPMALPWSSMSYSAIRSPGRSDSDTTRRVVGSSMASPKPMNSVSQPTAAGASCPCATK